MDKPYKSFEGEQASDFMNEEPDDLLTPLYENEVEELKLDEIEVIQLQESFRAVNDEVPFPIHGCAPAASSAMVLYPKPRAKSETEQLETVISTLPTVVQAESAIRRKRWLRLMSYVVVAAVSILGTWLVTGGEEETPTVPSVKSVPGNLTATAAAEVPLTIQKAIAVVPEEAPVESEPAAEPMEIIEPPPSIEEPTEAPLATNDIPSTRGRGRFDGRESFRVKPVQIVAPSEASEASPSEGSPSEESPSEGSSSEESPSEESSLEESPLENGEEEEAEHQAPEPLPAAEDAPSAIPVETEQLRPSLKTIVLPETPNKAVVKAIMDDLESEVLKCKGTLSGRVVVEIVVSGVTGRVTSSKAIDQVEVGGTVGRCVAHTVEVAKFPPFERDQLKIKYPYNL